jgi:hypothetical protein
VSRLGAVRMVNLLDLDDVVVALNETSSDCWLFTREGELVKAEHNPTGACTVEASVRRISHEHAVSTLIQTVQAGIRYLGPLDLLDTQAVAQVKAVPA